MGIEQFQRSGDITFMGVMQCAGGLFIGIFTAAHDARQLTDARGHGDIFIHSVTFFRRAGERRGRCPKPCQEPEVLGFPSFLYCCAIKDRKNEYELLYREAIKIWEVQEPQVPAGV